MGMDVHRHRRNLNTLVVGGSGAGKTRFFCKPGIMSCNCSYLITDPKGEMLRATGNLLKEQGYEVKVFNLIAPDESDGYNPFSVSYLKRCAEADRKPDPQYHTQGQSKQ